MLIRIVLYRASLSRSATIAALRSDSDCSKSLILCAKTEFSLISSGLVLACSFTPCPLSSSVSEYLSLETELSECLRRRQRIITGVAGEAEVCPGYARGLHHPFDREVMQAVQADEGGDFRFVRLFGGDELPPLRKIDPVGTGVASRRAAHDHVKLLCTTLPQVPDTVSAGRSPDDGILDDHDLLADNKRLHRIELDPDAEIPHRLTRLDEGSPHVMIADHPHFERNPALLCVTESCVIPRIGERHDEICIRSAFLGEVVAESFPAEVDVLTEDLTVGPGEIDQFEDAVGWLLLRQGHEAVQPCLVDD